MSLNKSLEISPQLENIRCVSDEMISEIYKISNDSDLTFRIDIALTEAVTNAIKHGPADENSIIRIEYISQGEQHIFHVEDKGRGPENNIFKNPQPSEDRLLENKRGAIMIHWAADEIIQQVDKSGYKLTLIFKPH